MARLCERPGCAERGAIAYGFDADRLLVWLLPLDPQADRNRAGVLCLRHADAMVVPIGWTLDDARDPTPRLFRPTGTRRRPARRTAGAPTAANPAAATPEQLRIGETEPTLTDRSRTVAEVTGVAGATTEDPDATTAIPWMPDFDETDDLGGVLDAHSPLLSRAFRGPGRRR
jgi:hypothetical protein